MTSPSERLTDGEKRSFVAARTTSSVEPAESSIEESRTDRLRRHARRAQLYAAAIAVVALLVILVALIAANATRVKLDWIVGSTHASLVWIIVVAAAIGWLLGIATSVIFRWRTARYPSRSTRAR